MNPNNSNLHMYKEIPRGLYHRDKLKRLIKERLRLYGILETLEKLALEKHSDQWNKLLERNLSMHKLVSYEKLLKNHDRNFLTEDHISHWLLSLIYCKSDKLIASFVRWELQWFHARYQNLTPSARESFHKKNSYSFEEVDIIKVIINYDEFSGCNRGDPTILQWYKTRFENVTELLGTRSVYVTNGMAYFTEHDIILIIKYNLSEQLQKRMKFMQRIPIEDEVVADLLSSVKIVTDGVTNENVDFAYNINTTNIDMVANKHFPLCMKYIHKLLRKEHFLKYGCKMQYGVFLKSIGMPYEEALSFWKNEFLKTMTVEKYNKKYEYLFKHQYGKVGGKVHYKPDSCDYVINQSLQPMNHHGCPFKHWDFTLLKSEIQKNLPCNVLADIEDLVATSNYRQACTKYFNAERDVDGLGLVSSPRQYTMTSMLLKCEPFQTNYFDFSDDSD